MRFTLEPGGDLEVATGAVLGACRGDLAELTLAPGLRHALLTIGGQPLADDHVAGAPPWVAGSVMRIGAGEPDPRSLAVTAPWHLAVVTGPDAGTVAVPSRDGAIAVGRRGPVRDGGTVLTLSDPSVSRAHLRVRLRRRRWFRRARWVVQDLGSANGTGLTGGSCGPRGGRAAGRRERALRPGEGIALGDTVVLPRRASDVVLDGPERGAAGRGAGHGRSARVPSGAGPVVGGTVGGGTSGGTAGGGSWIAGAVASLALAAMTRNPVFLVLVLAGPLGMALPQLVRASRDRARSRRAGGGQAGAGRTTPPGPTARRSAADTSSPAGSTTHGAAHRGADPLAAARPGGRWMPTSRDAPARELGPDAAWSSVHALVRLTAPSEPGHADPRSTAPWWPLARDGLAVVGPRQAVLGVVRAALGAALLDERLDLSLLLAPGTEADWSWCRWLAPRVSVTGAGHRPLGPEGGAGALAATRPGSLLVADGASRSRASLHLWWMAEPREGDALLVLDEDRSAVPPWCRWVLAVAPDGTSVLTGEGEQHRVTSPAAPARWIEGHARQVAARDARGASRVHEAGRGGVLGRGSTAVTDLPDRVALADLGLADDTATVLRAWGAGRTRAMPGLRATLGVGGDGTPVTVDLLAEGPHMLVAGTTGAGKSELLQSLVLSLALRHPPTELAVVLIDYKGGASFGRCRDLPHVVGQVTDLDPVEAARALDGVRAELHRRERVLADAGFGDLESLRSSRAAGGDRAGPVVPPRLLVVVDEFRALTEDLPDFVPGLVRIAAQGRSLGIHLVLATQRPSGAVSGQMRANVALRLCLRVTEAADSTDVVEVPDAAALPVDRPGRAVLRRGAGQPEVLQTAWAALPPGGWVQPGLAGSTLVRWARPWPVSLAGAAPLAGSQPGSDDGAAPLVAESPAGPCGTGAPGTSAAAPVEHTAHLVTMMRDAAEAGAFGQPSPVWLAPLPATVTPALLRSTAPSRPDDGLPLALVDVPGRQARAVLRWDGRSGALVVAGRPGSGRTWALRTTAHQALAEGWDVHVVTGLVPREPYPGARVTAAWDGGGPTAHPGLGTVVGADDPRRVAGLLTVLLTGAPGARRLLLLDDAGSVWRALDRLPRGAATDLLDRVLRDGRHRGLAVAVSGAPADVVRLLPHASDRLVLAVADPHDDMLLGVPHGFGGSRDTPGRGVHLGPGGARRCQVSSPDLGPVVAGVVAGVDRDDAAEPPDPRTSAPLRPRSAPLRPRSAPLRPRSAPLRLQPVPLDVVRADLPAPAGQRVPIGRGGGDAGPVTLDTSTGALVVGPAGSGRSTALATIALALRAAGRRPLVLARVGPLADVGRRDPERHGTGAQAGALLERLAAGPAMAPATGAGHDPADRTSSPSVVVVDDLDLLAAADPLVDDLLARWATAAESGDTEVPRIVGAARTDRAATAYRGVVAALRSMAPALVLCPGAPGSNEVAGTDLSLAVDPRHPLRAGGAVIVHRGRTVCLQVAGGDLHAGPAGLSPTS